MLYLKKINFEDAEKEYKVIKSMPAQENGFENKYHDATKEEFVNEIIPKLLKNSEGLDLPNGYVPDTYFFLWDDDKIVGLFKIRHYLNDFLRKGAGHIGYGILHEYREKGYAKKGLVLAIEKCKEIIKEDEIYLSVHKDNPASLRVQLDCGAFIVGETAEEYLTRIKLRDNHITFGFRDLRRDDWKRITQKEIIVEDEKNELFEGKVCFLDMQKVESPLSVDSPIGKVTIADNNYKNLIFAPKGENWWLTVIFDDQDNLIESYFDITRINDFSNPENPYFVPIKLSVCIPNGHEPTIMDEDELKEAFEHGLITKEDYENAYNIANKIISTYNSHKEDYYEYIYNLYNKYRNRVIEYDILFNQKRKIDLEKIKNMEYEKINIEEAVRNKIKDHFLANVVIKYFKEELKGNEIVSKLCFKDLTKYNDILNEFVTVLVRKTYDIKNPINIHGYTAKRISELNLNFNICGVYILLKYLRDDKEKAKETIRKGLSNNAAISPLLKNNKLREVSSKKAEKYLKKIEKEVDQEMVKRGLLTIDGNKKTPMFGSCYVRWALEKKILKERYNIDWKTPAEKYPNITFD